MNEQKNPKAEVVSAGKSTKHVKIASQIARQIGGLAGMIFIAVAVIVGILVKVQLDDTNEEQLTLESQSAAYELNVFFQKNIRLVEGLSVDPNTVQAIEETSRTVRLQSTSTFQYAMAYMKELKEQDNENILALWIESLASSEAVTTADYVTDSSFDITADEWYQAAVQQKMIMTAPYEDIASGLMVVTIAAPVLNDAGKSIGIVGMDLSIERVTELLRDFKIGDTGYVIMMTKDSTLIYHPDESKIGTLLSDYDISSNVIELITGDDDGFIKYKMDGTTKYGYVTDLEGTNYTVLSSMPTNEYYETFLRLVSIMVVVFVIGAVVIVTAIKVVSGKITKPIEELNAAAQELAAGNLNVELTVSTNDEIGELSESLKQTVSRLKVYIEYINEITEVLTKMANGTLAISLKNDYTGDFAKIKDALNNISSSLLEIMTGISESSGQVSSGADDLAKASQTLAEGATAQAASVEELVATADSIVEELQTTKEDALSCAGEANRVAGLADSSRTQMRNMVEAMNKISETSNQVVGIIHTIEEIADQTNLLSLNASIEAARAGEAGRGFAVVAGEIGTLAVQSADAASTTKNLIAISISEVEKGVALANEVTEALQTVVAGIENVSTMVTHTADLSVEQENSMKQMQSGIESISAAVQDTSSTAEESSATSEELAAQATVLSELIAKFDLSDV